MSENQLFTLKLLGLSAEEKQRFDAILSLAEMGLKQSWQIIEQDNANFFILSYRLKNKLANKIPIERCIFYTSQTIEDSVNILPVDSHNTPRLRALIELFNQLAKQPSPLPTETTTPQPPTTNQAIADKCFNPQQGLLSYLLKTTKEIQRFSLHNQENLYVHLENKYYYSASPLDKLTAYFNSPTEMQCKILSENQFTAETHSLSAQPLNNLIYYTTLNIAQGLPPKQYTANMIVRLKRWPNLKLSDCQEFIRIATFMQSNSTNLATVAEKTATPLSFVYNFYNACQLIGFIEYNQEEETVFKETNSETKSLLSQISQRLNELSNEK